MKYAVSVSLGSSERDKKIEIDLHDQQVVIERRGTDGDIAKATDMFTKMDGLVDAFGVGGIDLHVQFGDKRYPLYAAHKLVKNVKRTPVVDGGGLKNTLECGVVEAMIASLGPQFGAGRVLLTAAVDRFGMTLSFFNHEYEVVCADLMFALGLPIPIRTMNQLKWMARLLLPIVGRFPISMLYPMGEKQEEIIPKFEKWYDWAEVIAGDCHYIKRHMPDNLEGKVIVTNTTTTKDMALFKERGVRTVLTTTPQIDGRSFGTNMLQAAMTAAAGKKRPLTQDELTVLLDEIELKPTIHHL
jgi:hypothetical protein